MAVVLALMAATAFAAGTVLQQKGTLSTSSGDDDPRFLVEILHERVWLAGAGLQATGWILQGAALDRGSLMVVQAITTLSLVIALPIGVRVTGQSVGRREIVAAVTVVAGIFVFVAAGAPEGGQSNPSAGEWWMALLAALALIAVCGGVGRARRGAARAAAFGTGAGIAYGAQAAVTKMFVGEIGHGVAALLSTWSTWVLIASALVGFALQQSALKSGVLAAAMASSNASTLVFSTLFGIAVFDERLTGGVGRGLLALAGLALAVIGVVRLATAQPAPDRAPA